MGEHEVWSPAGDLHLNGLLPNEVSNVTQFLDEERWSKAEERTAELLACIQPNQPSEERRNAVANYVQRLIMKCFSCEVFTFGSVPLKTYLPDGDIDLTAFSKNDDLKDTWAAEVREALENEEKSESSEFRVREVQYIQAEVKIIKCLVENIVVDISFNQVGGLCTLCFLEEIDHLINQNHLFKRSIILIKAWCYYESRILGAHHGLISTYALETLVLYIFHVFNNSFAGPLEVLYRFLEFFSRFDWDNFCISLWGPVPISSLPDMAAEPPRKDGGELLLNGDFLVNCSTMYAVFPSGQENHGQQFVSKHFNVIDPLRTNNNLGRSVSKGNFYRVRSAFAFGAKRLARLLGCPKENLIDEVNQFFMNTWQRHMTANRPDAPAPTNLYAQPEKNVPTEESSHSTESATEHQSKRRTDLHGSVSSTIQRSNAYRTTNSSMVSRSPSQKVYVKPVQNQKNLKANYADQEGQGSLHFARTQSSPSLTESSTATLYRARRGRVADTSEAFDENFRPDYENRRKNTNSEILTIRSTRSSFDEPSLLGPNLSEHNCKAASDSNSIPNSYHDATCLTTGDEEVTSVSTALELQQQELLEQQDMVNMMASSQVHNIIGQVQLPMHFSMPHHLPISSFFNSMAYGQRNLVTLVDPSWGSAMQFPQGFISPHLPQHISNASTSKSNFEELETSNESSDVTLLNQENREHSGWHDSDIGSIQGFETDVGELVTLRSDERRQNLSARQNTSSRVSNPRASVMRSHQKIAAENDRFRDDKSANLRHIPVPQAREGSKNLKAARNKWGRSPSNSEIMNSSLGRNDSKLEVAPESVSSQEDNERGSLSSAHSGSQLAGYEHAQISGADSLVPFAPMLVSGSRQKVPDGSGVLPFTFFPTGPPVPFVTMVPVYNFQADGSNSDRDIREGNFDFAEHYDQFENLVNLNTLKGPEDASSEEHKPDILNSDFVSHWQNLQYGRLCQNIRSHGPFVYSPPVVVPPTYLQGHFPMDGPGRPHSANANFFTQVSGYGPRLVPIALQPGPSRTSGVHNQYGDDSPRYRGGTGTYLPNPASLRERQFSTSRNHRSGYRHDRADETDREGSWINAKSRAAGRSHVRNQHEKSIPRSDRSITSDSRPWESYRPDQVAFHQPQNVPFRSSNLSSEPANPPYNLYPSSGSRSNNVVMLYPNDPHLGYRSTTDSVEFGSLGRVHMSNNEASIPGEGNPIRRLHDPRHSNRGVSQRSSPDQPSSPHITRAP